MTHCPVCGCEVTTPIDPYHGHGCCSVCLKIISVDAMASYHLDQAMEAFVRVRSFVSSKH